MLFALRTVRVRVLVVSSSSNEGRVVLLLFKSPRPPPHSPLVRDLVIRNKGKMSAIKTRLHDYAFFFTHGEKNKCYIRMRVIYICVGPLDAGGAGRNILTDVNEPRLPTEK